MLAARHVLGPRWTNALVVLLHKSDPHQRYHSQEILQNVLTEELFTTAQRKRKYVGTQYIQVDAEPSLAEMFDVPTTSSDPFAGFDISDGLTKPLENLTLIEAQKAEMEV